MGTLSISGSITPQSIQFSNGNFSLIQNEQENLRPLSIGIEDPIDTARDIERAFESYSPPTAADDPRLSRQNQEPVDVVFRVNGEVVGLRTEGGNNRLFGAGIEASNSFSDDGFAAIRNATSIDEIQAGFDALGVAVENNPLSGRGSFTEEEFEAALREVFGDDLTVERFDDEPAENAENEAGLGNTQQIRQLETAQEVADFLTAALAAQEAENGEPATNRSEQSGERPIVADFLEEFDPEAERAETEAAVQARIDNLINNRDEILAQRIEQARGFFGEDVRLSVGGEIVDTP